MAFTGSISIPRSKTHCEAGFLKTETRPLGRAAFRCGYLKIPEVDFGLVAAAMGCSRAEAEA